MANKNSIDVNSLQIPNHVAIIMDGNGRWAKKRLLPRKVGHRAGAEVFKRIVRYSNEIGIKYLTVYAFSTENWKRPQDEVNALIGLFMEYLKEALKDFLNENIKVLFMGEREHFPIELQELIEKTEKTSSEKTGMVLNICLDYGGRNEIVSAIKKISSKVLNNQLKIEDISDETVCAYLYCPNQPDPDLIIRPSGEFRLSNFLSWQSAYSEFIFMDTLWPDFKNEQLLEAIAEFNRRNRRFGGV